MSVTPNPSNERTATSQLRCLVAVAHAERWATWTIGGCIMISIFGSKDIRDAWYSITGFGLIFEVTDDPNDRSELRGLEKPIEIWILAWSEGNDAKIRHMSAEEIRSHKLIFCGSITKITLPEHRMWSANTFQEGWVSVIAAPTIEWNSFYTFRVYPAIKVVPGFRGNFAVSIPHITGAATTSQWHY